MLHLLVGFVDDIFVAGGNGFAIGTYRSCGGVVFVVEGSLEYCRSGTEFRLLRQIVHAQVAAEGYFTAVRRFFAGKDTHKGGFPRAVACHYTDFVALLKAERYVGKEHTYAVALCKVFYIEDICHFSIAGTVKIVL